MELDVFEDGSSIEWFSRESLAYREKNHMVQVEYDYFEVSSLRSGRKIYCDSVEQWEVYPPDSSPIIPQSKKNKIIEVAIKYFRSRNIPVEIEK